MEKSEVRVNLLFFHVSFPFLRSSFSKGQAKSRTNHKDKIKNNLNNPETNPRTPTLRTNPQITKMVLVWVERDELEIGPLSMVARIVGGRAKELGHESSESIGVGSLFFIDLGLLFPSSLLICRLLCDLYSFFLVSLWNSSLRLNFHIDFCRNQVVDTRVATVKPSLLSSFWTGEQLK